MDRPHRGPAGTALASHTPATADLPVVTPAPGTAKLIEARNLEKLFGQTPALRGATIAAGPGEILAGWWPRGVRHTSLPPPLGRRLPPRPRGRWVCPPPPGNPPPDPPPR